MATVFEDQRPVTFSMPAVVLLLIRALFVDIQVFDRQYGHSAENVATHKR